MIDIAITGYNHIFWGWIWASNFPAILVRTKGYRIPACTRVLILIHFWPFHLPSRIGVRTAPATSILCFSSPHQIRRILHPMPSRNCGRRRRNSWLVGTWIQVFRWRWVGEGSAWWHLCPKICKLRWAVWWNCFWLFFWWSFLFHISWSTGWCFQMPTDFMCILCSYVLACLRVHHPTCISQNITSPCLRWTLSQPFQIPKVAIGSWIRCLERSSTTIPKPWLSSWIGNLEKSLVVLVGCKIALGSERSYWKMDGIWEEL